MVPPVMKSGIAKEQHFVACAAVNQTRNATIYMKISFRGAKFACQYVFCFNVVVIKLKPVQDEI